MELLQLHKIITFSGYRIAKYREYMVLFVQLKKVYVTKMFCILLALSSTELRPVISAS